MNIQRPTALIIGSTGTVGRPLVRHLDSKGVFVKAATRTLRGENPFEGFKNVERVVVDLQDRTTYAQALQGVDRVFLLTPAGNLDAFGLLGSFAEYASKQVSKIVTMTAQGVERFDELPARRLELAIESTGVNWVHLRPTWFMQNFQTYWYGAIREHGIIPVPAGDSQTAFVSVEDIAACAAAVLAENRFDNQGWELTGPKAWTYADAAQILSDAGGRKITYVPVEDGPFIENLVQTGLSEAYGEFLVELFKMVRGGMANTVTDSVQALTGRPATELRAYAHEQRTKFS